MKENTYQTSKHFTELSALSENEKMAAFEIEELEGRLETSWNNTCPHLNDGCLHVDDVCVIKND